MIVAELVVKLPSSNFSVVDQALGKLRDDGRRSIVFKEEGMPLPANAKCLQEGPQIKESPATLITRRGHVACRSKCFLAREPPPLSITSHFTG